MKVIDTHCDALLKLQQGMRQGIELDYQTDKKIETNANRLKKGNVFLQFFTIFIDPDIPSDEQWQHALEQVDLFYSERSEEHTSELQSRGHLVCRLLLEKKKT